mgnify:FL=1
MTTKLAVAETILAQLGGRRFLAMTGAKNLIGSDRDRSLSMKLGRGALHGITHLRVTLDASDTYTVTFSKVRGTNVTTVAEIAGVYAEDLASVFTTETGFATRLKEMSEESAISRFQSAVLDVLRPCLREATGTISRCQRLLDDGLYEAAVSAVQESASALPADVGKKLTELCVATREAIREGRGCASLDENRRVRLGLVEADSKDSKGTARLVVYQVGRNWHLGWQVPGDETLTPIPGSSFFRARATTVAYGKSKYGEVAVLAGSMGEGLVEGSRGQKRAERKDAGRLKELKRTQHWVISKSAGDGWYFEWYPPRGSKTPQEDVDMVAADVQSVGGSKIENPYNERFAYTLVDDPKAAIEELKDGGYKVRALDRTIDVVTGDPVESKLSEGRGRYLAVYTGPNGPISTTFFAANLDAASLHVKQHAREWFDDAANYLDLELDAEPSKSDLDGWNLVRSARTSRDYDIYVNRDYDDGTRDESVAVDPATMIEQELKLVAESGSKLAAVANAVTIFADSESEARDTAEGQRAGEFDLAECKAYAELLESMRPAATAATNIADWLLAQVRDAKRRHSPPPNAEELRSQFRISTDAAQTIVDVLLPKYLGNATMLRLEIMKAISPPMQSMAKTNGLNGSSILGRLASRSAIKGRAVSRSELSRYGEGAVDEDLSRVHYVAIASAIAGSDVPRSAKKLAAELLAARFEEMSPAFSKARFVQAALKVDANAEGDEGESADEADLAEAAMTKQHFAMIAQALASMDVPLAQKKALVGAITAAIAPFNPNFNHDRFVKATGLSPSQVESVVAEAKKLGPCECGDPGCPMHKGKSKCKEQATRKVRRIDMGDSDYIPMCDGCADDALDSGVFSEHVEDDEPAATVDTVDEGSGPEVTVGYLLTVLTGGLTQYDKRAEESAKRAGRHHSIYAIGHYLGAVERVAEELEKRLRKRGDQLGNVRDRSDREAIEALLNVIPDMLHDTLPPVRRFNDAVAKYLADGTRPKYPGVRVREDALGEREFSKERRDALAGKGQALDDGSYPIVNREDLANAIRAFGRANPEDRKRVAEHIAKRAKALDAEDMLPEDGKLAELLGRDEAESVTEARLGAGGRTEMMRASKEDDAKGSDLINWQRTTRAWMDDGKILEKRDVRFLPANSWDDPKGRKHSYGWKLDGRIKKELMANPAELAAALTRARDSFLAKGWKIETFAPPSGAPAESKTTPPSGLVEIAIEKSRAQELVKAARDCGLGSDTKLEIRDGKLRLLVPEDVAAKLRTALPELAKAS